MKVRQAQTFACVLFVAIMAAVSQSAANGAPEYDPAKEIKVKGRVLSVEDIDCPKGQKGILLRLAAEDTTYEVHVGPASWLEKLAFPIEKGDTLEITGAVGPCGGKQVLNPREITRGTMTVSLRDQRGSPLWSRPWSG